MVQPGLLMACIAVVESPDATLKFENEGYSL